ncbi:hypothetical protein J6590_031766 [Homalodisca vitripennis]|nr:hypothetical protein J6590_031766 [Homalodisca vitripennis]
MDSLAQKEAAEKKCDLAYFLRRTNASALLELISKLDCPGMAVKRLNHPNYS